MSLLVNNTLANPTTSFYAALGGGGGGGASSLQSPATITPDGTGEVSLTAAATGGGDSLVSLTSAAASVVAIDGIQSVVTFGTGPAVALTNLTGNSVLLISESENGSNPTVEIDVAANDVVLCNPAAAGGSVTANNPITLNNNTVGGISGIVGVVTGGVALRNQAASGGSVFIGSSQGQPTTLTVNEVASLGQVVVGGRGVGSGITLAGGDTEAGASAGAGTIVMGTNVGTEKLYLGANGNTPVYKTIELRATEVLFNLPPVLTASSGPLTSQVPPNTLRAAGVVSPGTINISLAALQTGLWCIVGSSTTPTAGDYAAFFSTTVRMLANAIVSGGCVNGPTNTFNLTVTGAAQLSLQVANATSAAYTVLAYPIFLL